MLGIQKVIHQESRRKTLRNIKNRSIAIFYTCGTCNLKCTYCGIDKNPILAKIDKALEESFKGDYTYIRLLKNFIFKVDSTNDCSSVLMDYIENKE